MIDDLAFEKKSFFFFWQLITMYKNEKRIILSHMIPIYLWSNREFQRREARENRMKQFICDGFAHDKLNGATSVSGASPNASPYIPVRSSWLGKRHFYKNSDLLTFFADTAIFLNFVSLFFIIESKIYYIDQSLISNKLS